MADAPRRRALRAALGDSHVILLRGHRFHRPRSRRRGRRRDRPSRDQRPRAGLRRRGARLLLAPVRLRPDRRPMVFLVPDLEDYTAGVRGFLFPFEETAPGPLVVTTDEVVAQVRDVPRSPRHWAGSDAFDARFNPSRTATRRRGSSPRFGGARRVAGARGRPPRATTPATVTPPWWTPPQPLRACPGWPAGCGDPGRPRSCGRLLRPTVSVIVPIYKVEAYLAECLDSILGAGLRGLRGAAGRRRVARRLARDRRAVRRPRPRVRVVTRPNGGLGAARNTGVREARGRFLTFVDSDDVLPPDACARWWPRRVPPGRTSWPAACERFDSHAHVATGLGRRRPRDAGSGITVEEHLPLLRNLYTWNKLFRRDFWDAQGLWFREGVAYEDQPIITQLLARARSDRRDHRRRLPLPRARRPELDQPADRLAAGPAGPDRGLGGEPRGAPPRSSPGAVRRLVAHAVRRPLPLVPHQRGNRRRHLLERAAAAIRDFTDDAPRRSGTGPTRTSGS